MPDCGSNYDYTKLRKVSTTKLCAAYMCFKKDLF